MQAPHAVAVGMISAVIETMIEEAEINVLVAKTILEGIDRMKEELTLKTEGVILRN
jgi:hypothetical protein